MKISLDEVIGRLQSQYFCIEDLVKLLQSCEETLHVRDQACMMYLNSAFEDDLIEATGLSSGYRKLQPIEFYTAHGRETTDYTLSFELVGPEQPAVEDAIFRVTIKEEEL